MASTINTNVSSLTAQRHLNQSQSTLATALNRLSSGLRINGAKDDAAGLAISERFSAQVRGLNQAARNANDAISMLQTAEGAMGSATEQIQRMRELAVQAANSTNSASDKEALQKEVSALLSEINRNGQNTEFNGQRIFDQSTDSVVGDPQVLNVYRGLTEFGWLEQSEKRIESLYGLAGDGATLTIKIGTSDGSGGVAASVGNAGYDANGRGASLTMNIDLADFDPANFPNGGSAPFYNDRIIAHEMTHAVMARATNYQNLMGNALWFLEGSAEMLHGADERLSAILANDYGGNLANFTSAVSGRLDDFVLAHNAGFSDPDGDVVNMSYGAGYVATRVFEQMLKDEGKSMSEFFDLYQSNPTITMDAAIDAIFTSGGSPQTADDLLTAISTSVSTQDALFQSTFGANWSKIFDADTGAIGGQNASGGAILSSTSVINNTSTRPSTQPLTGFNVVFDKSITDSLSEKPEFKKQTFQVGANSDQTLDVSIGSLNTKAMGIDEIDLTKSAQGAIVALDRALDYVSSQRAHIGAGINRLNTTISNLSNSSENLSAAKMRVLDADYAVEMATFTKTQILQQAGTAMLAQANSLPNSVLSLLRS